MGEKLYSKKFSHPLLTEFLLGKRFDLCLEIGCFEGYTSNILVEHLNDNGKLICIDPLTNQYLVDNLTRVDKIGNKTRWKYFAGQYDRFINNVNEHLEKGTIKLVRKLSKDAFIDLKDYEGKFDFCYIDGDHRALGVYIDGKGCFELCKNGGYILFDDYEWTVYGKFPTKKGIDRFLKEYAGQYKIIAKQYQILIQKLV